jgi:thiamine pyrophosphokinase
MTKRAIILSNGVIEDPESIHLRLKDWGDAIVIAADGGYHHAEPLKLALHSIVGDLDSVPRKDYNNLLEQGVQIHSYPSEKDETDLELALLYAIDQEVQSILILGAVGGRLDMTLSNLFLMSIPELKSVHVETWFGVQRAWVIHAPGDEIRGQPGDTLSLIPLSGTAKGITTKGLKYPLKDDFLKANRSRGLSNVLSSSIARVDVDEGMLLAIHTPGRA